MATKKLIIGNWKMNPSSLAQARTHFTTIKKSITGNKNVSVALAAPFVYLPELAKLTSTGLALAAQNVSAEKEGPFTGEVSVTMLAPLKVSYVILGHSERRTLGETNTLINRKLKAVLGKKMIPVLCIGETERDSGMWYLGVIKTQIEECLAGVPKTSVANIVIAYEPVWALSSTVNRRDATPEDCCEMRIYVRKVLTDMFGAPIADKVRIIYGGSVDDKNARAFLTLGEADGLLPGKASLKSAVFTKIVKIANEIN